MHREKLYKAVISNCFLPILMVFLILKMSSLHFSVNSNDSNNVGSHFCFAYILTRKDDEILNFLLKDVPSKVLQNYYRQSSIPNQKAFGVFSEMIRSDTAM